YGRLTRADLDAVVPDRPAFIVSGDVHSLLANSKALAAAGITRATPDPPHGIVVKDNTGEPTGVLRESAQGMVTTSVPKQSREERRRTLRAAIAEAQRSGVTSLVNIGGLDDVALFDEAQRAGE